MKRILWMAAVAMMAVLGAQAQKIEVVDAEGHGIPLVSVLTEDGNLIGTTDLNGVINDVKGAAKVAVTHVAFHPQLVSIASLNNGRITMEALDYELQEIVVKPKPYIYVETYYRAYAFINDSLRFYQAGILQPESETWGTVYTIHSKVLADSVLSQLTETTWAFLEDNPGVSFHFKPHTYYGLRTLNELFENLDYHRLMGFYHIYLHHIPDLEEFNIVVLEGTGDMMVPMEWLIVKSWKNGKVVYDKKRMKNMTSKEARSNTSGHRFTQTRQYTPVD